MFYDNIFNEFTCVGGKCINTCCRRWHVSVDEATAKFYLSLMDEYGSQIKDILRQREDGSFFMPIDEYPCCPMLTDDRLCGVYQHYGENRMGQVCRTFPRTNKNAPIDGFSIALLSNQCEEVLRMMLDGEEPLRIIPLSDEDRFIEKSDSLSHWVYCFIGKMLDLIQDKEMPFGIAIGCLVVMMVDIAPDVFNNNRMAVRNKINNTDALIKTIVQVIDEFSSDELQEFSWNTSLKILVGFLDILFKSNFAQYEEILPILEKYTDQGLNRGEQIFDAFQVYVKMGLFANEILFRKIIANVFLEYVMCLFEEKAIDKILYEFAPRVLITLVIPSLWPDSVMNERDELLPRLSMLQRIVQGGYIRDYLSPAIKEQMKIDEGTYAVLFSGVLG